VGLGEYYLDIYGYHKFGERPDFLIDERMHEPHIFGYGAMEILGHKRISQHSKLKVCAYLFETIEPDYENGVPYGLLTALGHLAAENSLSRQQFLKGVLALEYQNLGMFHRPIWTEGATTGALVALADWLAACPDMNSEEKTWWAWKLSVKCDSMPHLGKGFATRWLDKEEISAESKLALCRAWLTDDKRFGVPPLEWSLAAALQMGNLTEAKRLIQEAGIDPRQVPLPSPEELPPAVDEEPDPFVRMLRSPQHYFLIPTYLKRLAIPAVVRFGEDLMDVIDAYWGAGDTYDADALGNGVADAIQEFHQQLAPDILRRLVEQGIQHNKATVRKTFYALSMQFYGGELLEQALEDNAKSIRNWAGKKLAQNI
jgi:hypothetical protein